MTPDEKTRLLIGSLAMAVIAVVGYGVFQALQPAPAPLTPTPPPAPSSTAPQTPASPVPYLLIKADNPVIAGSNGNKAAVTADVESVSYEWTIQGGTIEGDTTGSSILWNAGTGSEVMLSCSGTNASNMTGRTSVRIAVRQPPRITRFEASQTAVTEGSTARLSWNAENVQKLILSPEEKDVTKLSGPGLDVTPRKTMIYTLTATNDTGLTVSRELQIKVVPPPQIMSFRAEPVTGTSNAFVIIGEFKDGKAVLKRADQVVTSSEASPLRIQLSDLKEGASLALTVTNEAGAYVSSSLNFSVEKK